MKLTHATLEMDSNGNIRKEDNMVTIIVKPETGNSVRLFCKIDPEKNTIIAFNTAIMGIVCPCCNSNTFACSTLYNKRHKLLREAYELLKENHSIRLKLLFDQFGELTVK
ncbi:MULTISPECIES: hypothetical protein [Bacillus cereus group]|uniref:Uncharacterized protein n=2 Tax=Bacillus thuringiensis TaxID=1428 RepID=A0ABD5I9J7_BACTU|nr:hypothetical protein [Bacillus thuringiensis]MCR6783676.1 hypothetical protein [Bacillus thuringiensis]MCR6862011.1 hypothetical protein [Bacillus thuringiensis]MCR6869562.1 hypothetical protein [Bacillus thuringiensis]MDW9213655.1 hypothetical protein [Bacillus thuringiensis serovar toumanoffi]MED2260245.1 hypothetical protein [Bacillus thuringiensis]